MLDMFVVSKMIFVLFSEKFMEIAIFLPDCMCTFFGNISMVKMYGIGSRPMQLMKTIHATQNGGIHSYSGLLIHRQQ